MTAPKFLKSKTFFPDTMNLNIHLIRSIIYGIVAFILFIANGPGFIFGFCLGSMVSSLFLYFLDNV